MDNTEVFSKVPEIRSKMVRRKNGGGGGVKHRRASCGRFQKTPQKNILPKVMGELRNRQARLMCLPGPCRISETRGSKAGSGSPLGPIWFKEAEEMGP